MLAVSIAISMLCSVAYAIDERKEIMRRAIILSLIVIMIFSMSACSHGTNLNNSYESNSIIDEGIQNSNNEITDSNIVNNQISLPFIDNKVISVRPIALNTDKINSKQIRNNDFIYEPLFPTVFLGNKIFVIDEYYMRSDNSDYDAYFDNRNIIKSFNIDTNIVENVISYNFDISYYPDFAYKNFYFTFPCTYEDNDLQINITAANIDTKEQDVIYKGSVTSPWYYADYLNSNEVVFLVFPRKGDKTFQEVLKFNLKSGNISVIYENEYVPSSDDDHTSENVWTFDTFNGHIFLLNTGVSNGKRFWSVSELDSNGNLLTKAQLDGLHEYCATDCSVNQFVVTENQFLIQFFDPGDNSIFSAIPREDLSRGMQFEKLVPCMLASPFLIEERFLIYSTCPDYSDYDNIVYTADFCVYDTFEDKFSFFKADFDNKYHIEKILSNEFGDVLLIYANSELKDYTFSIITNITEYL